MRRCVAQLPQTHTFIPFHVRLRRFIATTGHACTWTMGRAAAAIFRPPWPIGIRLRPLFHPTCREHAPCRRMSCTISHESRLQQPATPSRVAVHPLIALPSLLLAAAEMHHYQFVRSKGRHTHASSGQLPVADQSELTDRPFLRCSVSSRLGSCSLGTGGAVRGQSAPIATLFFLWEMHACGRSFAYRRCKTGTTSTDAAPRSSSRILIAAVCLIIIAQEWGSTAAASTCIRTVD
jgi:hypothetical protein